MRGSDIVSALFFCKFRHCLEYEMLIGNYGVHTYKYATLATPYIGLAGYRPRGVAIECC